MMAIENIHDLEVFCAIVGAGSFTGAARTLGITQPAVSLSVKRLERQLGTTLLDRHRFGSNDTALTDSGKVLARHAEAIVKHAAEAIDEIEGLERQQVIRLGLPPMIMEYYLAGRMDDLKRAFGGRSVSVCSYGSERMIREVKHHNIDVGAVASPSEALQIPYVKSVKVGSFPFCLAVPADHPLATYSRMSLDVLAQLPDYPFVSFTKDFMQHDVLSGLFEDCGKVLNVAAETDQLPVLKRLVSTGIGIGLVTSLAVDEQRDGLHLIPIVGEGVPTFNVFVFEDVSRPVRQGHEAVTRILKVLYSASRST
ncbi:MAG: LysR family transcriptional regulator [Atopobiaceae bacterium]|jgi:DNA-binding transcriptional LysR family regulator|nr:LysR family transcriptional regulator [Atopobiaceae bacterium]